MACAALAVGCGEDGSPAPDRAPDRAPAQESARAAGCERVQVPSHEAVDVRVRGVTCAQARRVIAAAVGKGRGPYSAQGLACEPADAPAGDTDYTCAGDGARLTFRYGAR